MLMVVGKWKNNLERLCTVCGKKFTSTSGLSDHERKHNGRIPYTCCGQNFFSNSHYTRHMCGKHGVAKDFKCNTCMKTFAIEGDLRRHERRNECYGAYTCDTCGTKLCSRNDLAEHMNKHSGLKTFRCPCGKTYRYHTGLSRHRKKCPNRAN